METAGQQKTHACVSEIHLALPSSYGFTWTEPDGGGAAPFPVHPISSPPICGSSWPLREQPEGLMVNQMPRPPLLSPGCAPGTYSLIIFTLVCVFIKQNGELWEQRLDWPFLAFSADVILFPVTSAPPHPEIKVVRAPRGHLVGSGGPPHIHCSFANSHNK